MPASATFHSNRGDKSALILVKRSKYEFSATPVYVPRASVEGKKEGDVFTITEEFELVDIVSLNEETGEMETRTTNDGVPLKMMRML